jgi:hypothetical protein
MWNSIVTANGTAEIHPRTGHEGPEENQRYNSILFLTSALDGGAWLTPRPGRFTQETETRQPLSRRLEGPQGRSHGFGISPLTGIRSSERLARYRVAKLSRHTTVTTDYITHTSVNRLCKTALINSEPTAIYRTVHCTDILQQAISSLLLRKTEAT